MENGTWPMFRNDPARTGAKSDEGPPVLRERWAFDTGSPIMNKPWTHAGVPAVTVPAGTVEGLPVGLQLTGKWMADESLLARAAGIAETVSS